MTLIEGIGDEVTHFFITLFIVIIVSLAWWTTNISEQRHIRTVLLLDRRRHRPFRRLTNHTETVTITDISNGATTDLQDDETDIVPADDQPSSSNTPAEATTSSNGNERGDDNDESRIIRTMDTENCVVRQRRLAFYDNWNNEESVENTESTSDFTDSSNNTRNIVFEETTKINSENKGANVSSENTSNLDSEKKDTSIRIKLKYINDDLKLVEGKLEELLGDFKKRHFQMELTSNKLVRLIFNGQVLHQDTQTLQSCGLFDNCVVHCLIHPKRTRPNSNGNGDSQNENIVGGDSNLNNNNHQPREWDFGNSLFACISVMLLAAWYLRYVYAHLYTVTATIGLIFITGIFTIVLVGMYFPENENLPNPRIHIQTEHVPPSQQ